MKAFGFVEKLFTKCYSNGVLRYVFWGGLTTLVNWASFFLLRRVFGVPFAAANAASVVAAVLFAYFVNSRFVFRSDASGFSGRFSEFVRFVAGRALSMALEIGGGELLVGVLRLNESVVKVAVLPVFVLTVNYFVSRFFVFGKKADNGSSRP